MFLLEFPEVTKFFNDYPYVKIVIDAVLALFLISLVIYFCIKFKKALYLTILGAIMVVIFLASEICNFELSKQIYGIALGSYVVIVVVLLAPELRKFMEYHKSETGRSELVKSSTQATKEAIVDAVFNMSQAKVGALITIELHQSLEQYAERAIPLNSDITRELLEQIFIKDSPLHDGGVIIRGNKIICAAAYYTLTQDITLDKTVGSRHRAGIGLSEITDSLTIIVSEETGDVQVATGGFALPKYSKTELLDYIDEYLASN